MTVNNINMENEIKMWDLVTLKTDDEKVLYQVVGKIQRGDDSPRWIITNSETEMYHNGNELSVFIEPKKKTPGF